MNVVSSADFVADMQTVPALSDASHSISASSLSNTDDKSAPELLQPETKTVADKSVHEVLVADEQLDKSAVDDADDIIESSSPLRRDVDDDDADLLSTSFAVPVTTLTDTNAVTCNGVIPPALTSLPSLMQLSRQALDARADRSASRCGDETSFMSHSAVEMFSEDDEQDDSMADITQVL